MSFLDNPDQRVSYPRLPPAGPGGTEPAELPAGTHSRPYPGGFRLPDGGAGPQLGRNGTASRRPINCVFCSSKVLLEDAAGLHEEGRGRSQCADPACGNVLSNTNAASSSGLRTWIRLRVLQSCQRRNVGRVANAFFTLNGLDLHTVLGMMRTVAGAQTAEWRVTKHRHGGVSVRAAWALVDLPSVARFLSFDSLLPLKAGGQLRHRVAGSVLLTVGGDAVFVCPPVTFMLTHHGGHEGQHWTRLRVR